MENNRRDLILNVLTYVMLVVTLCLVVFYALIGFGVGGVNPFPPPTPVSVLQVPSATPTPTFIATWTPTPSPTITPTPLPTRTRAPTLTPSPTGTFPPTPTFPPTSTPTPRATRAPFPFTCDVTLKRPEYDHWSGVAGHLQDLDNIPQPGYYVKVEGPVPDIGLIEVGGDGRINAIYRNDAAWEQAFNPGAYQPMEIRVQICRLIGTLEEGVCEAVSDVAIVRLGGYASGSLGYVTCTLNWEELAQVEATPAPTQ